VALKWAFIIWIQAMNDSLISDEFMDRKNLDFVGVCCDFDKTFSLKRASERLRVADLSAWLRTVDRGFDGDSKQQQPHHAPTWNMFFTY
jgi:hypothetical protein